MSVTNRITQDSTVFGHWQVKKQLGHGSCGKSAVFELGRNDEFEETSALKVINLINESGNFEELSESRRTDYEQALRHCIASATGEVRLMSQLRGNTNIVDYLDHRFVNWSDSAGFGCDMLIRMELLSDLRSITRGGTALPEAEVVKIGKDICSALILCHKKNILHRDIKPGNIFVNRDGNYKLGDFGISKILSAAPLATAGTSIGTPEYAAPEQVSGRYDKRVDIYSLGLVLYELSNGNRLPYAASTYTRQEDIERRYSGQPLPSPSAASSKLSKVILKACAYKAEDRYQSAEEFYAALCQIKVAAPIRVPAKQAVTAAAETTLLTDTIGTTVHGTAGVEAPSTTVLTENLTTDRETTLLTQHSAKKPGWLIPLLIGVGIAMLAVVLVLCIPRSANQNATDPVISDHGDSVPPVTEPGETIPLTGPESSASPELPTENVATLPSETAPVITTEAPTAGTEQPTDAAPTKPAPQQPAATNPTEAPTRPTNPPTEPPTAPPTVPPTTPPTTSPTAPPPTQAEHVHDYKVKEMLSPDCTQDGYTIYVCKCGSTYRGNTIAALGHNYTASKTVNPTCTDEGYTLYVCACGESYHGNKLSALGHSYTKKVVAPTYTSEGYTLYQCSRCGNNYKDDYTDALQMPTDPPTEAPTTPPAPPTVPPTTPPATESPYSPTDPTWITDPDDGPIDTNVDWAVIPT